MSFFTTHSGHSAPISSTPGGDFFAPSVFKPRVMGIILTIASCLIISTNLLVAAALAKILVKKRRQSWCFVLNLALADTLVGVAITGLATEDFNSDGNNNNNNATQAQGRARCLMRMAFVTSPCTASIMSMFLISLDRYAAIKMPLRYAQRSGKGVVIGALAALWISAFALGFMPGEISVKLCSVSILRNTGSSQGVHEAEWSALLPQSKKVASSNPGQL